MVKEMKADDLEYAINSARGVKEIKKGSEIRLTPEEEIGFHRGALSTLVAERNELIKMIGNVEAIMNAHIQRLNELDAKKEK